MTPVLTSHAGSLPRPDSLREANARRAAGDTAPLLGVPLALLLSRSWPGVRLARDRIALSVPQLGEERGVVVNTASVAAFDGQIGQAAYSASKGGVVGMTLPMARELARFGIRVMAVAPGLFETAMSAGLTPDVRAALESGLPFPSRMGRPDEFAMLVQQIVENPILNGEIIRIDSAVRLAPK